MHVLPVDSPELDIIIVNYHTPKLIENLLDSYWKQSHKVETRTTFYIINNDFQEGDNNYDASGGWCFNKEENLGYGQACNLVASYGVAPYLLFLNSDTEFIYKSNVIDSCINIMKEDDTIGVVGPMQYDYDGKITHAGIFGPNSNPKHRGWKSKAISKFRDVKDATTVSGSAMFVRRSVFNELANCEKYNGKFSGIEGAFLPTKHFYEETFLNYHAREHGYRVIYNGEAAMIHAWHKSSPVGSMSKTMLESKNMFKQACELHGIDHNC